MQINLTDFHALLNVHGTHQLTIKRLTMHNRPEGTYNKHYVLNTKVYRFFMTMVEFGA